MTTVAEQQGARSLTNVLNKSLGPSTSLGRNLVDAARATFAGGTLVGPALIETRVLNQINEELQRKTGRRIFPFGPPDTMEQFFDKLNEVTENFPDTEFDFVANSPAEVDDILRAEITTAENALAITAARRPGFRGGTVRFLGAAGAISVDPPTTASLFVGGVPAANIVRTFLREAGIVAAAEIPTQIAVQSRRSQLGLPAGVAQALQNISIATLGGGLLGTAAITGVSALSRLLRRREIARLQREMPQEVQDAIEVINRRADVEDVIPYEQFSVARAATIRLLDESIAALRENRGIAIERPSFAITAEAIASVRETRIPKKDLPAQQLGVINQVLEAGKTVRETVLSRILPAVKRDQQREAAQSILREPKLDEAIELLEARRQLELKRRDILERAKGAKTPQQKSAVGRARNRLKREFVQANPQLTVEGRLTEQGEAVWRSFLAGTDQISLALRSLDDLGFNLNRQLVPHNVRTELSRIVEEAQLSGREADAVGLQANNAPRRFTATAEELTDENAVRLVDEQNAALEANVRARIEREGDFRVLLDDEAPTSAQKLLDEGAEDIRANDAAKKCARGKTELPEEPF